MIFKFTNNAGEDFRISPNDKGGILLEAMFKGELTSAFSLSREEALSMASAMLDVLFEPHTAGDDAGKAE